MNKESILDLQIIDCNCNDCIYLERDFERTNRHKQSYIGTGLSDNLQYGHCKKKRVPISFIPNTCQLETQDCFVHRKDSKLKKALNEPLWKNHFIGKKYVMDGKNDWKIAYYPIFECGKTGKVYDSPRALVERKAMFSGGEGTDFREVPLHYLQETNQ